METYNLNATNKEKESNIKQIYNNKYYNSLLNKLTPVENETRLESGNHSL
jgi:hypothetical protein